MNISRSLPLLVGATCVFALSVAAQLLIKQQTLGDGIVVQIIGAGNRKGLRIMRDGRKIYKNMLNDGTITLMCVRASEDGKRYNIAARFGSHGDLYKAYAIVGNRVFPSPKYRNTASGDKDIPAGWSTPDRLVIKGTQPNTLSFDPGREKWDMAKGIVLRGHGGLHPWGKLRGWALSKLDGEIMAITSKRFFGYQMPAPKEVDAAIRERFGGSHAQT